MRPVGRVPSNFVERADQQCIRSPPSLRLVVIFAGQHRELRPLPQTSWLELRGMTRGVEDGMVEIGGMEQ